MTSGGTVERAVRSAVRASKIAPSDKAAAELAATYARQIDDEGDLKTLGPLLLAALEALQMTPRARAAVMKGAGGDSTPTSPLDELRRRRARKRPAADLDPAAP